MAVSAEGSVLAARTRAVLAMAGGAAQGPGVEVRRARLELLLLLLLLLELLGPRPMKAEPPRVRPRASVDAAAWTGRMMPTRVVMPSPTRRARRSRGWVLLLIRDDDDDGGRMASATLHALPAATDDEGCVARSLGMWIRSIRSIACCAPSVGGGEME